MREISVVWARVRCWNPANPGWWLLVVCLGLASAFTIFYLGLSGFLLPTTLFIAVPCFFALGALWWWLLRRVQIYARVSRTAMWAALAWGGAVSTFGIAVWANGPVSALVVKLIDFDFGIAWGAAIAAPLVEETAKGLGVVAVLMAARARLRNPVDAIILGVTVGLGFSIVENTLYAFNIAHLNFAEDQVFTSIQMVLVRGIFTGIPGHELMTGTFAAGLYYLWPGWGQRRVGRGIGLIAAAVGYHALWNSPLPYLGDGLQTLVSLGLISATGIALFVWLTRVARRAEQQWFRAMLAPEVAAGNVAYQYVEVMRPSTGGRRKHRRLVAQTYGYHAVGAQIALEAALVDLANARSLGDEAAAMRARQILGPTVAATPAT